MIIPSLRDYQQDMKDRASQAFRRHRSVILQAGPGAGKTRTAKAIAGTAVSRPIAGNKTGMVLFAVYGRGLVNNASDSFNEDPPLPHGIIMSQSQTNWRHRVQVGSIDTLLSWYCNGDEYESETTFDLVIFDEAHAHNKKIERFMRLHNAKRQALGLCPGFLLGLSATPEAKGLGDVYGELVMGPTNQWLIDKGHLSPFRYVCGTEGKLDELVVRAGRFTDASQHKAMDGLTGDLVRDWKRYGQNRPTIGFFRFLSHAREAQELLIENGIRAEYVDGKTPDEERISLFDRLGNGDIEYLCNVGVVARGTNIPEIACVQLCLAINELKDYLQKIGRGSRISTWPDCVVIDHGGNVKRLGYFEDEHDWVIDTSKEKTTKPKPRASIECPTCNEIYRGGRCPNCEYEPTNEERAVKGLAFDGSQLVEISKDSGKSDKPNKQQTNEQILISSLYRGKNKMTWKQVYGMASSTAKKQGTKFQCPKTFFVGGREYESIHWKHPDSNRRVANLFDFLGADQGTGRARANKTKG